MTDTDAVQINFTEVLERARPTIEACKRINGSLPDSDYIQIMRMVRTLMAYERIAGFSAIHADNGGVFSA